MKNILNISKARKLIPKLSQKKVLVGGCFDIIHLGHTVFLEKAKNQGEILIVLLESDQSIKKLKGQNRPINSQITRAKILSSLKYVDFVVLLPPMTSNDQYDQLITQLKPDIIAATKGDPQITHKKRQAVLTGAKLLEVTPNIKQLSTTKLSKLIFDNFGG